ncbi:eukaryotic translation initiation factor 3 subunit EifCc [Xylona heveae TC161]|uniref:Eukaryotic translation initiation factor 3 subunit C n=1 Tax=Xylona heveae (strain CBS 132557 / TC161) TaxID=1328760 RepID=A0A165GXD2_XYLHT|nr:eukaryotic translation initiation factor 3 subunit EifCc [Xylona heveae TC161]KZF22721.1 eukaryotic translation initiation factor 3 subunit EifCc [Xylona heveae TC161]
MSRFFHAGDSSSESSSSDEEELYSEEEEQSEEESSEEEEGSEVSSESESDDGRTGAARFMRDVSDSEESEDEDKVTIVKSAKDKRLEELEGTVRLIDNAKKINDWAVISTEFDKMNRQIPKLLQSGPIPRLYIKSIADLEDFLNETLATQKVSTKKMNATNARGLNAVKQRIKKNNKDYAKEIDSYRSDKDGYMLPEDEEQATPAEKTRKPKATFVPGEDVGDEEGFSTVGRGGKTLQYTPESILKHLRIIVESRGKKNTDRLDQIRVMEKLFEVAQTTYQKIRVLLTLISTRFDLSTGGTSYMSQEQWKSAEREFGVLLQELESNPTYVVLENAEEWEDDDKQPQPAAGERFRVPGSIVSCVERLDDELTRSLQQIDPHTAEYVERLADENVLHAVIVRALLYIESVQKDPKLQVPQESLNRIVMRRLEHVYFKPSQVVTILEENTWKSIPENIDSTIANRETGEDTGALVRALSTYLFAHSEGIIRARAMLCQVYFLALHDKYYQARDMLLMSHLQETIGSFDINTQILFNRTLVQVGLCAFRAGLIYEAQTSLQEICGSGRQKELLAQGVQMQRYSQVSPEQERLERQRQLPFHMHINLELLECVYLTSSMLLEIPLLAQTGSSPDIRKRIISKTYRRMLEYHERQIFTGPPENTRDHVMQASKALAAGEWKKSSEFIHSIKIWELMSNPEAIKNMLSEQIQEEGLRTYLFTYAPFYDTLSISELASMFELPERKVAAVVSKMISHEELAAALDQVNSAIVFRKGVELSRLQSLALTLSDKASSLIESNERTLEQRTQGTANAFERGGGAGGRGGRGGARGGRGPRTDGRGLQGGQGRRPGGGQFTGGALGGAIKA